MARGRPRLAGERYASGDLKPVPPVSLDKRAILVGRDKATDPRAGFPIGVLRLRGQLTVADYAAAMKFAGLYAALFGKGQIRSHLEAVIYGLRGAGYDGADEAERQKRMAKIGEDFGQAAAMLQALPTRRPYDTLLNIAVFERPMRFMDTARARSPEAWRADQRDLEALQEATDALVTFWKIDRKDAA